MDKYISKSGKIPSSGVLRPTYAKGYAELSTHRKLLDDELRNRKFKQAIRQTVKAGDVVIDVGTGTGILAFYAVEAGARLVYAIDQHKSILDVARKEAKKRGLADKIQFIQAGFLELSQDAIPQKADVVVSEMIAVFGLEEAILPLMLHAKNFMKPGGKFIPRNLSLFVVPFQLEEELLHKISAPCLVKTPVNEVQFNRLSAAQKAGIIYPCEPEKLLCIDFSLLNSTETKAQVQFKSSIETTLYGLCGWFETELDEQITLSNSPHCQAVHWNQMLFKLPTRYLIHKGDNISARFKSISEPGYTLYVFDLSGNNQQATRITGLFMH